MKNNLLWQSIDENPAKDRDLVAQAIVFIDGQCLLCKRLVNILIKLDPRGKLRFAPLQGRTAAECLASGLYDELRSVVVLTRSGEFYVKSDALLKLMEILEWPAIFPLIFRLLPRFFRDFGYDLLANFRYRLFGRENWCGLDRQLTNDHAWRFLP